MAVTRCATLGFATCAQKSVRWLAIAALAFVEATAAQTLDKALGPTTIADGGTSVLTFTLSNPAGTPAVSNVGFVDSLPSGLRVANPSNVGGTCANAAAATIATAGTGTIMTTNLQVPAGASTCTVTVNVTNSAGQVNASCAGNPAAFTNSAGNVTVTNVTNGINASCMTVLSTTPTLAKSFNPTFIADGGTTTLTFTVTAPAGAPAVSNVGFVDTLPSGLRVANPANVGGTCANAAAATIATAGTGTITTTNLQVQAGASTCTVTVNVTNVLGQVNASCAGSPAAFTNSAGNVTVTNVTNAIASSCISMPVAVAPSMPVPTLSEWALMMLAALLVVAAARLRRRRSG